MAEKPKNDIEQLLSDYAEQRHDAAGTPKLHPATRRILQSEVRRQFPSPGESSTQPGRSRWSLLWPRIAVACGVVAAVAAVLVVINPPGKGPAPMEMARMKDAPATPAQPAALSPAVASTPDDSRAVPDRKDKETPVATKGAAGWAARDTAGDAYAPRPAENMPAPATVSATPPAVAEDRTEAADSIALAGAERPGAGGMGGASLGSGAGGGRGGGRTARAMSSDPASAEPALATAAPRTSMKLDDAGADAVAASSTISKSAVAAPTLETEAFLNNSLTQRYRNVAIVELGRRTATPNVLDEFTVEQNGRELKVVDNDGSVYKGYVEAAPAELTTNNLLFAPAGPEPVGGFSEGTAQYAVGDQGNPASTAVQATLAPQLAQAGAAVQAQNLMESQNYYFRVEGTNRSLQQRVVFTGNMIQNSVADSTLNNQGNTQRFRQQNQAQMVPNTYNFNLQMQNNFINGRVVLGDGKMSTEMNALPVNP